MPHLLLIAILWALIYVPGLFHPALLDDADSVHAEAAREMVLRHDWVTLYVDGIRYLEKAPLMYWGVAASFTLFGVHEWSARLPLALAVLALLLEIWSLGRRAYGDRAGFYIAWIAVAPSNPNVMWVATRGDRIFVSTNAFWGDYNIREYISGASRVRRPFTAWNVAFLYTLALSFAATFLMFYLWGFPFDKATRTSAAPRWLMRLHRVIGYAYFLVYVLMMTQMVPRMWRYHRKHDY